jgi:hypothetical protein
MHFFMSWTDHARQLAYLQREPEQAGLSLLFEYGFYPVQVFWIISDFVFAVVYLGAPRPPANLSSTVSHGSVLCTC